MRYFAKFFQNQYYTVFTEEEIKSLFANKTNEYIEITEEEYDLLLYNTPKTLVENIIQRPRFIVQCIISIIPKEEN